MEYYVEVFERIKASVENGADINQMHDGESYLFEYIEAYIRDHIFRDSEWISMLDDGIDLYDLPKEPFPAELLLPLDERDSEVLTHLNWFFENGANPNLSDDKSTLPVVYAAMEVDAPLMDYLIKHGANPSIDDPVFGNLPAFYLSDRTDGDDYSDGYEGFGKARKMALEVLEKNGIKNPWLR